MLTRQRGIIPVNLIVYGLLAAAAVATFLAYRHSLIEAGRVEVYSEWRVAAQEQLEHEARQAHAAATKLEARKEKSRIVYREIVKKVDVIVERPIYNDVCFDTDGLRAANEAISAGIEKAERKVLDRPGTLR